LRLGKQLGADHVVNLDRSDPIELVAELSGGQGCDTFMECAGTSESVALGLSLLRRRGRFLQQGLIADPAPIRFDEIAYKEFEVVGTLGQKWSAWERGLALMARGLVQVEPLISDVLPMSAWEKAFGLVASRAAQKVLLQPDAVCGGND
jgi:L-iditol 2-dehydrogenase